MQITTILPVSRVAYLDRILESLKNQTYKSQSLLVIFDGPDNDFVKARNKVVGIDYQHVLFVKSTSRRQAFSIAERRQHIVSIHNQFRELIGDADWIFSVEDDGILPPNALERLVKTTSMKDLGLVSGVELGRWGVPYVGAWRVDNISDPTRVTSLQNRAGEDAGESIDACGLYCSLIRADLYKQHDFTTRNGLGPDVNLGLFIRQQGFQNYIDWGIPVTHLTNRVGLEMEIPATDTSAVVVLTIMGKNTWHQAKYAGQVPS